jgi:hypothetical protein
MVLADDCLLEDLKGKNRGMFKWGLILFIMGLIIIAYKNESNV